MLYAFTDESYSHRRYFQAAFVVDEAQLPQLNNAVGKVQRFAKALGVEGEIELHGHGIMSAQGAWSPLQNRFDLKIAVFKYFVEQLSKLEGSLLIQGVVVKELKSEYGLALSPHQETSKKLLRSINHFSQTHETDTHIYSDKVSKEERRRIRFDKFSEENSFQNIKSVNFVDSLEFPGIQIADMCIYLYRRLIDHEESNPRTKLLVEELWDSLALLVDRNLNL